MSDTLNEEIAQFGLRSICFDFGCFRTPIIAKLPKWKASIDAYQEIGEAANAALMGKFFVLVFSSAEISRTSIAYKGVQKGDPVRGADAMIDAIKGEGVAKGKVAPSGFALGVDCYETVKAHCEDTLKRLEAWKELSFSTDYPV